MRRTKWSSLPLTAAALVACALAGCQTAPVKQADTRPPAMQKIAIDTPGVPGAQCSLSSVVVGHLNVTTPADVEVDRSPEIIVVRCRKACFLDASAMISSEGQRYPDGQVIYSYPAQTLVPMKPVANCPPAG